MDLWLQNYNKNILMKETIELPILTTLSLICDKNFVPKGCLPCDGSEYSIKQFKDFFKNYLQTGYALTCSYSEYGAEVAQYGQCGKFAIGSKITPISSNSKLTVSGEYTRSIEDVFTFTDGVWTANFTIEEENNGDDGSTTSPTKPQIPIEPDPIDGTETSDETNSEDYNPYEPSNFGLTISDTPNEGDTITFEEQEFFRVPLIKDGAVVQQALSDKELGKSYNAGVPNIEGQFKADRHLSSAAPSGAFAVVSGSGTTGADDTGTSQTIYYDFYASRCSNVYGNSDTVQPNAVSLRHFVVVANGTVNQSMMDWSKWASSLQGKLNADHSNDPYPYLIETSSKELLPYWYKVYSNGWCEQGSIDENAVKSVTITLLKPYISKTHYSIKNSLGGELNTGTHSDYSNICSPIDGASFELKKYDTNVARYSYWETKGFIK